MPVFLGRPASCYSPVMAKLFLAQCDWSSYEATTTIGIFSTVELAKEACQRDTNEGQLIWRETAFDGWESHPYVIIEYELDAVE